MSAAPISRINGSGCRLISSFTISTKPAMNNAISRTARSHTKSPLATFHFVPKNGKNDAENQADRKVNVDSHVSPNPMRAAQ